jgi:monovalent cation:H+ antiporter-2, CPA2 family
MEFGILQDIVIIFALSTFVNFIFTKLKIPTIIGYLVTGIVAGPHLLGIIGASHDMEVIAEIGIIFLMFTIGMEFSLNHLLRIRRIVFLGGLLQMAATAAMIMVVAHFYELDWVASGFIGVMTALSSTAVVLKILQERSEITSNYGRTVVGILIFQDLIIIPLLLLTPLLGEGNVNITAEFLWLGLKGLLIIALVYVGNKWIIPKLLHIIAMTRNQELFFMSILLICMSIAFLTYELGMSLAFGAFLGGLMISDSEYSHNAFGNLIPFKDTFTSFFFVSIGMLLDLGFVMDNIILVSATVLLVIGIKMLWAGATAFVLGHTFRGTVMVGFALAQVGEFSFILAKVGLQNAIISEYYYQLFLAVAVTTMALSPFLIMVAKTVANQILKLNLPPVIVNGLFPLKEIEVPDLNNHLVLIGKDSRALNLAVMANHLHLPYASIVFDPGIVRKRQERGEIVLYGDAMNEPILLKAHVDTAGIVVVSIGDLVTSMAVVEKIRRINKRAYILVRTKQVTDIEELYTLGADQVIPEEFETAIDLFERIMGRYMIPHAEIEKTIASLRNHHYGIFREKDDKPQPAFISELPNMNIAAFSVGNENDIVGKTLQQLDFRNSFGVTLVAIKRNDAIIDQIGPKTKLLANDTGYILGKPEEIANALSILEIDGRSAINQ